VEVYIHVFLTSALVGGKWSGGRFNTAKRAPGTHWLGTWVGPRTGLDDRRKRKILPLPGHELRPHGSSVCSQLLYRLRYPSSHFLPVLYVFMMLQRILGVLC
jgi:hypothetical protein